jgi:hypothetical protein
LNLKEVRSIRFLKPFGALETKLANMLSRNQVGSWQKEVGKKHSTLEEGVGLSVSVSVKRGLCLV